MDIIEFEKDSVQCRRVTRHASITGSTARVSASARTGSGTVKPLAPYLQWLHSYTERGDRILVPCTGTAPTAVYGGCRWTPARRTESAISC